MKAKKRLERMLQDLNMSGEDAGGASPSDGEEDDSGYSTGLSLSGDLDDRGPDRGSKRSGYLMEKLEDDYRKRTTALEEKCASLAQEKAQLQLQHQRELQRRDEELHNIQHKNNAQLLKLAERQEAIEAAAPLLQRQLAEAKDQLSDLWVSDTMYDELLAIPAERRPLKDHLRIAVHDKIKSLASENERLRREHATATDAAARAAESQQHLERSNARLAAQAAAAERDAQQEVVGALSRVERLEKELEEATVRAELLAAKGTMYEEAKARADRLEAHQNGDDNELKLATARVAMLEAERERLGAQLSSAQHQSALLTSDKAYLTQEASALREQNRKLEAQVDRLEEKLGDTKKQRQQLYDRLLSGEEDSKVAAQMRAQSEVDRVRAECEADLERLRRESAEVFEREARMLKQLREEAVREAEREAARRRDAEGLYDELATAHRELQKSSGLSAAELRGELKVKAFEVDRLEVLVEEAQGSARSAKMEAEMLRTKVAVLTDNFYATESASKREVADTKAALEGVRTQLEHYQALERDIDEAVMAVGGEVGELGTQSPEGRWLDRLGVSVPTSIKRRVQQALSLAKRNVELEKEKKVAEEELSRLRADTSRLQAEVARHAQRSHHAQQPYGYLVEALQRAESESADRGAKCEELESQLRRATADRDRVEEDLKGVLKDRGALHAMRTMLATSAGAPAIGGAANPTPLGAHSPAGTPVVLRGGYS
eukprot:CAMPEP_0182875708 /NCGR_PEP_ID=MMETSP0034_2-20130328/13700_1 /TAXON_ID=156128 /ORGANISM="Nephroselmis pyriformis, Strain CCMP717" /LENGTH=721 /DNA_ID=CAMNT_0025008457 /DNA_START=32 /DNA_END=2193 /DNA_ORIENTATION=-